MCGHKFQIAARELRRNLQLSTRLKRALRKPPSREEG
jgi:hypothetical protein